MMVTMVVAFVVTPSTPKPRKKKRERKIKENEIKRKRRIERGENMKGPLWQDVGALLHFCKKLFIKPLRSIRTPSTFLFVILGTYISPIGVLISKECYNNITSKTKHNHGTHHLQAKCEPTITIAT